LICNYQKMEKYDRNNLANWMFHAPFHKKGRTIFFK
jgi:hypothetical protein